MSVSVSVKDINENNVLFYSSDIKSVICLMLAKNNIMFCFSSVFNVNLIYC